MGRFPAWDSVAGVWDKAAIGLEGDEIAVWTCAPLKSVRGHRGILLYPDALRGYKSVLE